MQALPDLRFFFVLIPIGLALVVLNVIGERGPRSRSETLYGRRIQRNDVGPDGWPAGAQGVVFITAGIGGWWAMLMQLHL